MTTIEIKAKIGDPVFRIEAQEIYELFGEPNI
jgi:hypothetical protein